MSKQKTTDGQTPLDDGQILEMYFARHESAIKETDKKYGRYLYAIAYNILKNREDSEECVNDVYMKAWRAIPPEKPRIFRAFLVKILRGVALDRRAAARSQKRIPSDKTDPLSDFEGVLSDCSTPDEEAEAREIGRMLSAYLRVATDRKMYIFMSRYYFFTPIAQIARKLGCSESTVHKEIASIKRELREKLEKEGIEI